VTTPAEQPVSQYSSQPVSQSKHSTQNKSQNHQSIKPTTFQVSSSRTASQKFKEEEQAHF
jgi:hypothetical protein